MHYIWGGVYAGGRNYYRLYALPHVDWGSVLVALYGTSKCNNNICCYRVNFVCTHYIQVCIQMHVCIYVMGLYLLWVILLECAARD